MKYKNEQIEKDFIHWLRKNPPYGPFMRLYKVLLAIDALSRATGHGDITVTDFLRAQDFDSYHSKGQAADIRVRGHARNWYEAMVLLKHVILKLDWQCQIDLHLELLNKDQQHLHVEIDDNSLTTR